MTTRNVTITSKNQITLPVELVRKLKLGRNRRMEIRLRGNELILKPEPTLQEVLQPIRDEFKRTHPDFQPLSDTAFKQAASDAFANRWAQLEQEGRA